MQKSLNKIETKWFICFFFGLAMIVAFIESVLLGWYVLSIQDYVIVVSTTVGSSGILAWFLAILFARHFNQMLRKHD